MYIHYYFRRTAVEHLIEYSLYITFICTGKLEIHVSWFIDTLALSQWTEMETAVSPRNACKVKHVHALIRLLFQLVYFLKLSSNWNIHIKYIRIIFKIINHILSYKQCGCSVTKSCLTLCVPMNCTMPSSSLLHYTLEMAQIHVHLVGDAN